MAPNQRAANKKVFSVSLDTGLLDETADVCKDLSMNRNAFITEAIAEKIKKHKEKRAKQQQQKQH